MTTKADKTVLVKVWKSWKIVSEATSTSAVVREDEDGNRFQWVSSGKRVHVKKV